MTHTQADMQRVFVNTRGLINRSLHIIHISLLQHRIHQYLAICNLDLLNVYERYDLMRRSTSWATTDYLVEYGSLLR